MTRRDRDSIKIIVCPATGERLCKDLKWRGFATFGTYRSCVKTYRLTHAALKAAARYRHPQNTGCAHFESHDKVVHLHDGDVMDASGKVTRANGYVD